MCRYIEISVIGKPAPQGSKRAFVNKHTGRASLVESSKHVKPWREAVRWSALEVLPEGFELWRGAVRLQVRYIFARPKSHYGSGRNSEKLKASAPHYHTQKPDREKLDRAICDALTGVVYVDDSQVFDGASQKMWGVYDRAEIILEEVA